MLSGWPCLKVWHNLHMQAGGDFTLVGSGRIAAALQEMGPGNDVSMGTHACCLVQSAALMPLVRFCRPLSSGARRSAQLKGPLWYAQETMTSKQCWTPRHRTDIKVWLLLPHRHKDSRAAVACQCHTTHALHMQDTPRVHVRTQ